MGVIAEITEGTIKGIHSVLKDRFLIGFLLNIA